MPKPDDLTHAYCSERYASSPRKCQFLCYILMMYYQIKSKIYVTGNFLLKKVLKYYQQKSVKYFCGRDKSPLMFFIEVNPELNQRFYSGSKNKTEENVNLERKKGKLSQCF